MCIRDRRLTGTHSLGSDCLWHFSGFSVSPTGSVYNVVFLVPGRVSVVLLYLLAAGLERGMGFISDSAR